MAGIGSPEPFGSTQPFRLEPYRKEPPLKESARIESSRIESARIETARMEPPNRMEPNRMEPNRMEPNRMEPNRMESTRMEPNRMEPNRMEPNRMEPNRMESNRMEPNRMEPNRMEPNRMEPNRMEPIRMESTRMDQTRIKGPPCKVCGDESSGFHYGVDSCEGCKGFFRRCITQGMNHKCAANENCDITPFSRNSCQFCRLKKCYSVGMSRDASRLGRRPKRLKEEMETELNNKIKKPSSSVNSETSRNSMQYQPLSPTLSLSELQLFVNGLNTSGAPNSLASSYFRNDSHVPDTSNRPSNPPSRHSNIYNGELYDDDGLSTDESIPSSLDFRRVTSDSFRIEEFQQHYRRQRSLQCMPDTTLDLRYHPNSGVPPRECSDSVERGRCVKNEYLGGNVDCDCSRSRLGTCTNCHKSQLPFNMCKSDPDLSRMAIDLHKKLDEERILYMKHNRRLAPVKYDRGVYETRTCDEVQGCSLNKIQISADVTSQNFPIKSEKPSKDYCVAGEVTDSFVHRSDDVQFEMSETLRVQMDNAKVMPERMELVDHVISATVDAHISTCNYTSDKVRQGFEKYKEMMKDKPKNWDMEQMKQGMDFSDPTKWWEQFVANMAPVIKRVVSFSKKLPGFRELSETDQITLIKQGSFEVILARYTALFTRDGMFLPEMKAKVPRPMVKFMPFVGDLFEEQYKFADKFNVLGLNDHETGILTAVMIMNPEREGLSNTRAVFKLQLLYLQSLYIHMKRTRAEPCDELFDMTLATLPLLDYVNKLHSKRMQEINLAPEVSLPDLHREVFGNTA